LLICRIVKAILQNLSKDIRECYLRAEECRRLAERASTPAAKQSSVKNSVSGQFELCG
jgi:hypothetical protein